MTAIAQALSSGHSTRNILRYLSQQNPELAQTISSALEAGHSIDHVVNFISRNEKKLGKLMPEKTQRDNPFKKAQTSIHPSLQGAAKAAAMTAGAFGGGMALSRAIPSILQRGTVANAAQAASSVPMPSGSPQSPLPTNQNRMQSNNASTNPQSPPLSQQPPINPNIPNTQQGLQQPPLSNANAASIPEPSNIEQDKGKSNIVDKLYSGFEKGRDKGFDFESDAFLKVAKRMKSTGEIRSKEDFEKFFNLFDAKKNEGKDLPTALKEASIEYDGQKLSPTEQLTPNEEPQLQEAEPLQEPIEQPQEQEKQNRFEFIGEKDFTIDGKITPENELNIQGMFFKNPKGGVYAFPEDVPEDLKNKGYATNSLKKLIKESQDSGISKVSVSDASDESLKLLNRLEKEGLLKKTGYKDFKTNYDILDKEDPKIEKNSVVSSPNGVGEVKEIRNGQAIVEVDGKLHKVKEEELQAEPEEVKKAKIEFNLDDVDESLRSAPLNEVYAPAHRKHVTIKYNSDVGKDKSKRYIFFKKDGSPVGEDIIQKLKEGSQLPVSNGKTFWGGWSADTQDSRGTVAYHELSSLAQKEGEEDDPTKPYWFEEEEEIFTHGYSKLAERKLIEQKKIFDAEQKALNAKPPKPKKPKKKRA